MDAKQTDIEILREMRGLLLITKDISNEAVMQIDEALSTAQNELREGAENGC